MKIKKFPGLLSCIIILASFLYAEQPVAKQEKTEEQVPQILTKKCKNRIVASPFAFYTPETRLAFGAAGSYVFRTDRCKTPSTRPSSLSPVFVYTLEKQIKVLLNTDLYLKDNTYHIKGEIRVDKYPFKFYGIGNNTQDESEEIYTPRNMNFFITLLRKLGHGFNLGFQYRFLNWKMLEIEEGGLLASGQYIGANKGTLSGISVILDHDTRDNIYFPRSGDYAELVLRTHPKFLGSTTQCSSIALDVRKYFSLFSSHVLATQFVLQVQSGDVPFTELTRFGGENLMRGYYAGRYRDKNMMALQAEYRLPLFWRFGMVAFGGLANVANKLQKFDFNTLKPSYGVGLRLLFDKKENIWIRLDFGFGKGSSGVYATVYEAF